MKKPSLRLIDSANTFIRDVAQYPKDLSSAPIITATGPINFIRGQLRIMPPDVGLLRLLGFHRRAIGFTGPFLLGATSKLTPREAKRAFGNALIAVLAQISVIPQVGRERLLDLL
jgi:hypothetical protein